MNETRIPPHNLELEMQVLGAMILSRTALIKAAAIVDEQAFYRGRNRHIYAAIMQLYTEGKPIDLIILSDELTKRGVLEECGGIPYIADIASSVGSSVNVEYHADLLREMSVRRKAIALAEELKVDAYEEPEIFHTLSDYNTELLHLGAVRASEYQHIGSDVDAAWSELERESRGEIIGTPTGWPKIDRVLHFRNGSLNTIAGESGHGKSVMLANIACNAAICGIPTAIFSLEMSIEEYQSRIIKHIARTPIVFGERLTDAGWQRLKAARERLKTLPIYFDATAGISPDDLRARCQQMYHEHDIRLIIVDYLQLMRVPGNEPLRVKLGICTGTLKQVAKELHLPVITASQFRKRGNSKERTADDLAESKSIETDSDVIILLKSEEQTDVQEERGEQTVMFTIEKQRNGVDHQTTEMIWYKRYMTFECKDDVENATRAEAAYRGEPRDANERPY